jgi:integrase
VAFQLSRQWEAALRTQMQRVLVGLERDPGKNTMLREFREIRARRRSSRSPRTTTPRPSSEFPKSTLQHQMQRTCRKLKIEGLSLHSFRHTFGTRLGEAGASAHVVKQLMGHSSITVSQHYVHKLTESVERSMAVMEEANEKVGTFSAHVPGEDVARVQAKLPNTSTLRVRPEL